MDFQKEIEWLRSRGKELEDGFISRGPWAGRDDKFLHRSWNSRKKNHEGDVPATLSSLHPCDFRNPVGSDSEHIQTNRGIGEPRHVYEEKGNDFDFASIHLLSIVAVLVTSGQITLPDTLFVAFVSFYTIILAVVLREQEHTHLSMESKKLNAVLGYLEVAVGLFFPLIYALGGFTRSDSTAVQCSTPHIFFVSCHFLSKILLSMLPVSQPPRIMLSTMYTTRLSYSALTWYKSMTQALEQQPVPSLVKWQTFGKLMALINMLMWMGNLLGYQIPIALPKAFEDHFGRKRNVFGKANGNKEHKIL